MPESKPTGRTYVSAAEIAAAPQVHIKHPFNDNSDIYLRSLSRAVGLQRLDLSIARVPPGKESFIYHAHERDEEFLYILSGRGRAEIDGKFIEVGPGDFMGFPTPSVAHHLMNPYGEDLVYLMGGEHSGFDIGVFPRIGKRVIFHGYERIYAVDDSGVTPLSMADFLPDGLPGAPGPKESKPE
jgi:uncharacterized cupin superfamily protein